MRNERARYALIRIFASEKSVDCKHIWPAVTRSFAYQFGLSGSISAGLYFLEERSGKDFLVIRVNHENVSQLRAAIAAITQINGIEVILWVSRISGTVKSLMRSEASENT